MTTVFPDTQSTSADAIAMLGNASVDVANIRFGDNPDYAIADFLAIYPQFGPADFGESPQEADWPIPETVLQMYVNLASSSVNQTRWLEWWELGMANFIGHFATLWLQRKINAGSTAAQIAAAGVAKGMQVSKGVDGVYVGQQFIGDDLKGWASFKLTAYGQDFATLADIIGMGAMLVI